MRRWWGVGLMAIVLCLVFAGCANTAAQEGRKTLGIVLGVTDDEFNAQAVEAASNMAKALAASNGLEFEFHTAHNAEEQQAQLQGILERTPGVVLLWPLTEEVAQQAVTATQQDETELLLYQSQNRDGAVVFNGNNTKIGELTARYLDRYFGDSLAGEMVNILEITDKDSSISALRSDGLAQNLGRNFHVAATLETDGSRQNLNESIKRYISMTSPAELKKIQAIVCQNDMMLMGVIDALQQAGPELKPKLITGVGADIEVVESLKNYPCDVVTYSYSPQMLADAVMMGVRMMSGERVPATHVEPVLEVDKYTVDAYIQGDCHTARYGLY